MADAKKTTKPEPKNDRLVLTVLIDGPAGTLKAQVPHTSQEEAHRILIAALGEYYQGMREAGLQIPRMRPAPGIVVPKAGTVNVLRN